MIVNGIYIPIFDLIAAFFCTFTAAEIVSTPTDFGMEMHRTPRKQRKWNWLNWLCMVPMQKWLYAISIVFAGTVIWEMLVMPYMVIAIIIRFVTSLVSNIMFALILKKNKGTEKETILLGSTLFACAVWLGIVITIIGL